MGEQAEAERSCSERVGGLVHGILKLEELAVVDTFCYVKHHVRTAVHRIRIVHCRPMCLIVLASSLNGHGGQVDNGKFC
jgi:hypothetical protein